MLTKAHISGAVTPGRMTLKTGWQLACKTLANATTLSVKEQEVAGKKRPDLRLHSRTDSLGNVSVEIKLADKKWSGDELVSTPDEQLSRQYLLESSSHTGIYVLVNAARPRNRETDKKGKTRREAFCKMVAGSPVNFEKLVEAVEAKCTEINDGSGCGKTVSLVARDISEKPSETI